MSVKGTILEGYKLDIRDFTESQMREMTEACKMRAGNKELQQKILSAIEYQSHLREKYFRRVAQARRIAYSRHLNERICERLGIPESTLSCFRTISAKVTDFAKSLIPSSISIYSEDHMEWPKIEVRPETVTAPHIIATMPPECVNLSGWERLKWAFMPQKYFKNFDPNNPSHTYNVDAFWMSTMLSSAVLGIIQGYEHAKRDLGKYKENAAGQMYESKYMGWKAREHVFMRSLVRYGLAWGWRIGFIYAVTYGISQSMAIYKLKDQTSHYVLAAAVPATLYKWKIGPIGMMKTGLLGAIMIGLPAGIIFGDMGYNPRVKYYYANIESKVTGPLTEAGMDSAELLLGQERLLAILELLRTRHSEEINNNQFYRDFVGTE